MEKSRAIELLKLAVPIKALTQQEYADFVEAVNMGMDALKTQLLQKGTTKSTTSDLISRQQAIDGKIVIQRTNGVEIYSDEAVPVEYLKNLPSVQPEPTDINAKEAVYNLAEKIGIHQLFALTVELRGEPIQPEPKEGHWIRVHPLQNDDSGAYMCSVCKVGMWEIRPSAYHYCPNCGAKMKGATE